MNDSIKVAEEPIVDPESIPLAERVAAGMAWLDRVGTPPGRGPWRDRVNVSRLDMACDYSCVLGQIYGLYQDGYEELDLPSPVQAARLGFAILTDYGVTPITTGDSDRYRELTEAWRQALTT